MTALAALGTSSASSSAGPPIWPQGMVIAYKCADSLCLTEPGTGVRRRLLASSRPWPQWDPAFSPDGQAIAFRGYYQPGSDGAYALYVAPTSGCSAKRLTRGIAGAPAWSPDGRWIAFVRDQRHGSQIWLMRANGSDKHLLHTDATAVDQSLAWSHDGRWIAFARSPATDQGSIAVLRADGSGMHTLTSGTPAWNPVWMPNDAGIAYLTAAKLSNGNLGAGRVHAVRPDATGKHAVAGPRTIQFTSTAGPLMARRCT